MMLPRKKKKKGFYFNCEANQQTQTNQRLVLEVKRKKNLIMIFG